MLEKQIKRQRRHKKVRAKISGTKKVPRLYVFKSNQHIYAQLIDDEKGETLVAANDLELKDLKSEKKIDLSRQVGKLIAKKSKDKKITKVVFDRGGYRYQGRIKALAEGAREGNLEF